MNDVRAFYVARSHNIKTGDIPTQYIGGTVDEINRSCHDTNGQPCPLLQRVCYAHHGTTKYMAVPAIAKKIQMGYKYLLREALNKRHPSARFVRFGAIGDPSAINRGTFIKHYNVIRKLGMGILSYTHFWKVGSRGEYLKGRSLASCDSWDDAMNAVKQGWRAALHVPINDLPQPQGITREGVRFTLCPAQRGHESLGRLNKGRVKNPFYKSQYTSVTCNTCGLCDPELKGPDIIIFGDH